MQFSIKLGRVFECSSLVGDFLVRFGARQFYWSPRDGYVSERVELPHTLHS
jgi:hypothetical protein